MGQSPGKVSAELAWKPGLGVPGPALLHLPHLIPPLAEGVSAPQLVSHRSAYTPTSHISLRICSQWFLLSLGLLSKPGLNHLVGKLQGPRAHTGEDRKVGILKR